MLTGPGARQVLIVNTLALTVLFLGYYLTLGTEIIGSASAANAFRISAALLALFSNAISCAPRTSIIFSGILFLVLLAINQNLIAINILFMLILVANMCQLSRKYVALAFFIPTFIVIAMHQLSLASGVLTSGVDIFEGRVRTSLGLKNPNQTALIYLSFVFVTIYLHLQFRNRKSLLCTLLALGISAWVIQATDSRTSMFSLGIAIFLYLVWFTLGRFRYQKQFLVGLAALTPFVTCGITFFLVQNSNPTINVLLSYRPLIFQAFMEGVSFQDLIFGWAPHFAIGFGEVMTGLDNGFLMLLSVTGLPLFIFFMLALSRAMMRAEKDAIPLVAILLFSSIFESFLLRPEIPVSTMFLLQTFWRPAGPAKESVRRKVGENWKRPASPAGPSKAGLHVPSSRGPWRNTGP